MNFKSREIKRENGVIDHALNYNQNHTWGRSYEERYENWNREGRLTRPSPQEIGIYKSFMMPLSGKEKILILGPTPELRDLVADFEVVVADLSIRNIMSGKKYMIRESVIKEIYVEKDWLSIPYPSGYFNIILGDLVSNQFPPGKNERKFFKTINDLAAPGGYFISRFAFLNSTFQPQNLAYKTCRILQRKWLLRREKIFAVATTAVCCTADHSFRINNLYGAQKLLEEVLKNAKFNWSDRGIIKDAITYLKENGLPGGRWWSYPTENNLIDLISEYFMVVDRQYAIDHPAENLLPIMKCTPKKIQ